MGYDLFRKSVNQYENIERLPWVGGEVSADAWGALLAAQVIVENADVTQVNQRHRPKVERIIRWLAAILTEQVWQNADSPFPATERALAGNLLAKLGDPRPGVGLLSPPGRGEGWVSGLPDILWCDVPEGPFLMGSNEHDSEKPQHTVHVPAFQISRYPMTNAQYQAFVEDGGYTEQWRQCWSDDGWKWKERNTVDKPDRQGGDFDLPNHPVVNVTWYEATAFCAWLTARLQDVETRGGASLQIRLPSEAEWEKVARGDDSRFYPWGNDLTTEHANYDETGLGTTSPVGCFPRGASLYGCQDMAGNVLEWCADLWHNNYTGAPDDGSVWEQDGDDSGSPLRGGGWAWEASWLRCACRNGNNRGNWGFRVVRARAVQ